MLLPQKGFLLEACFGVLEEVLEAILIDEKKKSKFGWRMDIDVELFENYHDMVDDNVNADNYMNTNVDEKVKQKQFCCILCIVYSLDIYRL